MADLRIKQVRSPNGSNRKQRETLRSIGLGKIGKTSERPDSEPLRGQLYSVRHLIEVED